MTTTERQICKNGNEAVGEAGEKSPGYVTPVYKVDKTESAYVLNVHLPGVSRQNTSVSVDENVLVVEGSKQLPVEENWTARHREITDANYRLKLNVNALINPEKISAEYHHGELIVTMPLREKLKPVEISVK